MTYFVLSERFQHQQAEIAAPFDRRSGSNDVSTEPVARLQHTGPGTLTSPGSAAPRRRGGVRVAAGRPLSPSPGRMAQDRQRSSSGAPKLKLARFQNESLFGHLKVALQPSEESPGMKISASSRRRAPIHRPGAMKRTISFRCLNCYSVNAPRRAQ